MELGNPAAKVIRGALFLFHSLPSFLHGFIVRIKSQGSAVILCRFRKSALGFMELSKPLERKGMRGKIGVVGNRGEVGLQQRFRTGRIILFHHQQYAAVKTQAAVIDVDSFGGGNRVTHFRGVLAVPVVVRRFKIDADTAGVRFHDFCENRIRFRESFLRGEEFSAGKLSLQCVDFIEVLDMLQGAVVAAADDGWRVHFKSDQVALRLEIGGIEMNRNLEFFVRLSRPGHGAQENGLFSLAAVAFAEPVVILGLVGGQLDAALETRHRPRVFSKLVIALAEQEVKRRLLRRLCDRIRQRVHGLVIVPRVKLPLRVGKRVLPAASSNGMHGESGQQQYYTSRTKSHSGRTGRICRFSLSDTSPRNATTSPFCKPERTSIIVGLVMPTVISRLCRRSSCTTKTNRLPPST